MRRTETGGRIAGPAFSNYYKKYMEIHPEIPRTFVMPPNVYTSNIKGKDELYTDMSPLPDVEFQVEPQNPGQEVLDF